MFIEVPLVSFIETLTTPYALDGFFILFLIRNIFGGGSTDKKMKKIKLSSNNFLKSSIIKVPPKKIVGKSILLHELGRISLVKKELSI
jgi:hypothetical protein